MLYQVTISTPDLSRFAELAVLLRNNGFENDLPRPAFASEIISDAKLIRSESEVGEARAEKKARKPREEKSAPVVQTRAEPATFDEAAYKAAGVAEATMALSKARGRDAVISLLSDFGQTGETPSARNIPQSDWAKYVEQAKKLSHSTTESSLV